MDTAVSFKAKVNNSYESEPSSGSSLSENNDFLCLDVENMNLPSLLKPRIDETEKIELDQEADRSFERTGKSFTDPTPALLSSQESPFRGFSESPFEKIKRRINGKQHTNPKECNGKVISKKLYNTIVTEDSCNAVDIMLSSQEDDIKPSGNVAKSEFSVPVYCELSFNGRIKGLKLDEAPTEVSFTEHVQVGDAEQVVLNATISAETTQFSQSFIVRAYNTEKSPDLFADDEDEGAAADAENEESEKQINKHDNSMKDEQLDTSNNRSLNCPTESSFAEELMESRTQNVELGQRLYRENCKRERELLRRIRKCLSGVPPPPSLTTPQLDLMDLVLSRKHDILNFLKVPNDENTSQCSSLFKPTHTFDDVQATPWRDILGIRYHGLSYNLTKASESNEYLSLSVVERFVGSETNSSYKRSPSSAKKRNARLKLLTQSPGNRLSHLAKRRAVFSSAHLATNSQKSTSSLGPQIIVDKKKIKHRRKATPKRKTPASKKKARKTPSSSARKRLFRCETNKPGPSRETSKRALFQSPARLLERQTTMAKPQIKPEIATRVEKSKRALFSPEMSGEDQFSRESSSQPFESLLKRKRSDSNYDDDVDELTRQSSKIVRTSENINPRSLKIKSQSFCIGAGSSTSSLLKSVTATPKVVSTATTLSRHTTLSSSSISVSSATSSNSLFASSSNTSLNSAKKLQRAHSDMTASSTGLTENQRKKLLWAVSQALQEKKITSKHESFKQYASVLARVVRRIFQEFYERTSTSNSETMLRLAKKYVYYVITGKSADEIYLHVKAQLDTNKRLSATRLTGYIGPEEYQQLKKQQQLSQSSITSSQSFRGSMYNLFSNENSMDLIQGNCSQQLTLTNHTQPISLGEETWPTEATKSGSKQRQIDTAAGRQNSSSKSNLGSLALRENSAQKNFTGKDQRNISPYASNSGLKSTSISLTDSMHAASSAKAKRQILFDS